MDSDSLAIPASKKVAIAGKEYEAVEMSVQQFIDFSKRTKELDENPDSQEYEKAENMMKGVMDMVPDCPKEVLDTLCFAQLGAIFAFCRGLVVEEVMKIYGGKTEESPEDKKGEPKKGRRTR